MASTGKVSRATWRSGMVPSPLEYAAGFEITAEQPGQERSRLGLGRICRPASAGELGRPASRGRPDGRRHEERRADRGIRPGRREETDLHVGLALNTLEMDGQEVLDLEPLRHLLHALALQELLGLDALLGRDRH